MNYFVTQKNLPNETSMHSISADDVRSVDDLVIRLEVFNSKQIVDVLTYLFDHVFTQMHPYINGAALDELRFGREYEKTPDLVRRIINVAAKSYAGFVMNHVQTLYRSGLHCMEDQWTDLIPHIQHGYCGDEGLLDKLVNKQSIDFSSSVVEGWIVGEMSSCVRQLLSMYHMDQKPKQKELPSSIIDDCALHCRLSTDYDIGGKGYKL